jgi:orotidine-5'-phosphate decarboxylase
MTFADRLADAVARKQSTLCVGLDPRIDLLPPSLVTGLKPGRAGRARAFQRFCEELIDSVAEEAVAVKPQVAFFEALGGPGITALEHVCDAAAERGLLVIVDAKRGDIGSTAQAYAQAWLAPRDGERAVADALTVNPYLGGDSLEPFLAACRGGAGIFVLARTSNPGGADLQEAPMADGRPLWERTAELIAGWGEGLVGECGLSSVGAVVGATHPEAVERARELMPRQVLLLPGVGAQGGSAADLAAAFRDHPAGGLVVAARSVIYAWRERRGDWQQAVRAAAAELREATPTA